MLIGSLYSTQESNTFNPRELSFTKQGKETYCTFTHLQGSAAFVAEKPLTTNRLPRTLILGHADFSGLDSLLRQLRLMMQCQKIDWNAKRTEMWSRIQTATNGGQEQSCTVCASHYLHFYSLWLWRNISVTGYLGQISEQKKENLSNGD